MLIAVSLRDSPQHPGGSLPFHWQKLRKKEFHIMTANKHDARLSTSQLFSHISEKG